MFKSPTPDTTYPVVGAEVATRAANRALKSPIPDTTNPVLYPTGVPELRGKNTLAKSVDPTLYPVGAVLI